MRRLIRLVLFGALVSVLATLARRLLHPDAPVHELNGHGTLVGSLDTWPPVPRAPTTN
jgi:hypothetical protein